MTVKRILAALAVLGALAGGTAAATSTSHATASNPTSFYHGLWITRGGLAAVMRPSS